MIVREEMVPEVARKQSEQASENHAVSISLHNVFAPVSPPATSKERKSENPEAKSQTKQSWQGSNLTAPGAPLGGKRLHFS